MFRLFLSIAILIHSSTVSAATFTPKYQRREISRLLSKFSTTLAEPEKQKFYDAYLAAGRAEDESEKGRWLENLAIELVEATGHFVAASREGRVDDARTQLREVMSQLAQAAAANSVFTKNDSSGIGCNVYALLLGPAALTWGGSALASMFVDSKILNMVETYSGSSTMLLLVGAVFMLFFEFRIPGTTRLAHATGFTDSMDEFWKKVGAWTKADPLLADYDVASVEDFRSLIGRELQGVTLEQACTSALLAPPPLAKEK